MLFFCIPLNKSIFQIIMTEYVNAIPEFNPVTDLPDHFFCIYYGIRRCGKTVMLRHMLYEMQERLAFHEVYLFSATIDVNSTNQYDFIPKCAQFGDIKNIDYHLRTIVDKQKNNKRIREENKSPGDTSPKKLFGKKKKGPDTGKVLTDNDNVMTLSRQAAMEEILDPEEYHDEDSDYHPLLIILDDCVNENSIRHSTYLNLLAVGGRHLHISVIILSQLVAGSGSVPPIIRTQADCIAVVAQPRSLNERNLIAEQYLTSENRPSSKADGLQLMNAVTEKKHRALFISTVASNARSYIDYAFKYGPVPFPALDPEFKIGTEEQWNLCDKKKKNKGKNLPNPFANKMDLHTHKATGDYLNGLSGDLEGRAKLYW